MSVASGFHRPHRVSCKRHLLTGGKERTEDEYRELYDEAGFDLVRIVPASTEVSVIEGVRR